MTQELILVDENDVQTGVSDKTTVHQQGYLHRAFSVFIFNSKNELLLQQRASSKYHSGGLWTNTCCSHPLNGEELTTAVHRRLKEEMGFDCAVEFKFHFLYRAELENGLTEHEFDHVFFGRSDAVPKPDPEEVSNWKYVDLDTLENDLEKHPENYTAWLKICFSQVKKEAFLLHRT